MRERLKKLGLKRLFLHAEELSWKDGATKRVFQAPLPHELGKLVGMAGNAGSLGAAGAD